MRADTVFAQAGVQDWVSTGQGLGAEGQVPDEVPDEVPRLLTSNVGPVLQAWALAASTDHSVLLATDAGSARRTYLAAVPKGVRSGVARMLRDGTGDRSPAFTAFTACSRLAPGARLLGQPRNRTPVGVISLTEGQQAGDTRFTAAVVTVYPVTDQGRDCALPVLRHVTVDAASDETPWAVDRAESGESQWYASCDVLDTGLLSPDPALPASALPEQVSSMVTSAQTLAASTGPLDQVPVPRPVSSIATCSVTAG